MLVNIPNSHFLLSLTHSAMIRIEIMSQNDLHWQLEENCEKPEPGKLGHSLAQVAQVAKVQSDHLLHNDDDGDDVDEDCDYDDHRLHWHLHDDG